MPTVETALADRTRQIVPRVRHAVLGRSLTGPFPKAHETAVFGMGCFWGAERCFWTLEGVWVTAVGYTGGLTANATYEDVCTGRTGHNEVVLVVFDPDVIAFWDLLKVFWERHDPTQGMRQGNDVGTRYRSGIYTSTPRQMDEAEASRLTYSQALEAAGRGAITTGIIEAPEFYYAEDYHQQYLAKNPDGYCGLGGTGVACALPGEIDRGVPGERG